MKPHGRPGVAQYLGVYTGRFARFNVYQSAGGNVTLRALLPKKHWWQPDIEGDLEFVYARSRFKRDTFPRP